MGKRRAQILFLLGAAVALLTFAIVFEARKHGFEWSRLRRVLGELEIKWVLLAAAIALLSYMGRAIRWAVLIRPLRPRPGMTGLLSSTLIGYAAVAVLGRAGEFVRPYLIAVKERVPFSSQLAAWFVERIYDILSALLIFGLALSQVAPASSGLKLGPALSFVLRTGGWFTLITCLLCLTLLVTIRMFSDQTLQTLLSRLRFLSANHLGRVEKVIRAFLQGAASTKSLSGTLQIIFWSLFEWILIAACYGCVVRAFGPDLQFGPLDVLIFMGFVSFGSLVQLPGVGGGVQVTAVLVLTEIFELPLETATGMALLIWLLTFVLVVPVGAILALKEGITWTTVKAARREAVS